MKRLNKHKVAPTKAVFAVIVIAALAVLGASPNFTRPYTTIMLGTIMMYVILSLSWNMFSGTTGYISLATASFFGVGVYVSAFFGQSLPLPLLMLAGGVFTFALALLIGAITLRLRGVYFTIFTLGIVKLLEQLMLYLEITISKTRGRFVVSYSFTEVFYWLFGLMVLVIAASLVLKRTRFGAALKCIAEGEDAAMHIGINATAVKVLAFAVSAFAVGAAGAAMATRWTYIDPYIAFNTNYSFLPVLMVIFGGRQHTFGPLIGAVLFAYIQEILITDFPYVYMLAFGIIMIVAILFMPDGILGVVEKIIGWIKGRRAGRNHADIAGNGD